ncbi:putative membrane protein [Helicobacter pylori Hp H-43]|nr:putative membrane protein [Helicobacter pylori Hp H-43]
MFLESFILYSLFFRWWFFLLLLFLTFLVGVFGGLNGFMCF